MSRAPLADLVSKGHWLVRAANGDYLDVEYDAKTGAPRLVTVPIYQVRHAFRISQLHDTRQRTWSVLVDPVPVAGVPDAAGNGGLGRDFGDGQRGMPLDRQIECLVDHD